MNIRTILITVFGIITTGSIVLATCLGVSNKRLHTQLVRQNNTIDSLLSRRMTVFDVNLYVTDKSVNKIYGRYNKGQITMPNVKTYVLDIDSTKIK